MANGLHVIIALGILAGMAAPGAGLNSAWGQSSREIHLQPKPIPTQDPFYQVGSITIKTRKLKLGRPSDEALEVIRREFTREWALIPERGATEPQDPMSIADMALKVWDIIQDNKAVLNVSTVNVKALPYLAKDSWTSLTGWKPEHGVEYSLEIKNLYGIKVVELVYEVRLIYGGSVRGLGKYIASARVVPKFVDVLWGYDLDVSVREVAVQNLKDEQDPFASIVLEVGINYGSIIKKTSETLTYRLNGDGEIHDLTTGNVYFKR